MKIAIAATALLGGTLFATTPALASAAPSDGPAICTRHVEYLDREFGMKSGEIYITACAIGPGNGGPDEILPVPGLPL